MELIREGKGDFALSIFSFFGFLFSLLGCVTVAGLLRAVGAIVAAINQEL